MTRNKKTPATQAHIKTAPAGVGRQAHQLLPVGAIKLDIRMDKPQPVATGLTGAGVHLPGTTRGTEHYPIRQLTGNLHTVISTAAIHHHQLIPGLQGMAKHGQGRVQIAGFVIHRHDHTDGGLAHPREPLQLLPAPAVQPKQWSAT